MPATPQRCTSCNETLLPDDQFCGNCGKPVNAAAANVAPRAAPRRRTGRMVLLALGAFVVVAGVSGLIVAFVDARRDVSDEQAKLAAAQAALVDLNASVEAAADPDAALQAQLTATQAELVETQAQLTQAQADLAASQEARTTEAAAAEAQSAAAVAAVQTQLDASQAQLAAFQALFPMDENTFRAAPLMGEFAVTIQPVECTIVDCLELETLSLSFPDATKVSGNRANGVIAFTDGSYVSTGSLAAEQAPLCAGAETEATWNLTFHATRVIATDGLLSATQALGTYRETIDRGDCAGQFRSYSVSMVKQ